MIKPATELPWYYGIAYSPEKGQQDYAYQSPGYYDNPGILGQDGTTVVGCDEYDVFDNPQDTAYLVHAANHFPVLTARIKVLEDALERIIRVAPRYRVYIAHQALKTWNKETV